MPIVTTTAGPIWRDTYFRRYADSVRYRIELDGAVIFSGKAVRYPGDDDYLKINVSRICRNYLDSDLRDFLDGMPTQTSELDHPYAQRTFSLYVDGEKVQDYRFWNDWSYTTDKGHDTEQGEVISDPINGRYVYGMLKPRTIRKPSRVYTEANADDLPGLGYTELIDCKPFVLYYLNSYGGWDAFVIEGGAKRRDTYTKFNTDKSFDNTTLDYELNTYVNEIRTSWELTTGFLSDEESRKLAANLLGSVRVYLQNAVEGWVRPVVITDTNVDWQDYQGNGKRMCQYRINVRESQSRLRK